MFADPSSVTNKLEMKLKRSHPNGGRKCGKVVSSGADVLEFHRLEQSTHTNQCYMRQLIYVHCG